MKTTVEKTKQNVSETERYSFVGSRRVAVCLSGIERTRRAVIQQEFAFNTVIQIALY